MLNFIKNNKVTVIILIATLLLGGIAIFTATRLYNLRTERVAPNVPQSMPAAANITDNNCQRSFTISGTTTTGCNESCTDNADCTETGQICYDMGTSTVTDDVCRHEDYPEEATCQPGDVAITCNDVCSTDSECQDINSDYECFDNGTDLRCRLDENTDSTTCQPITSLAECNESCSDDSDCYGSNTCEAGMCRNPNCTDEPDCECPADDDLTCNEACTYNSDCEGDLNCVNGMCRNSSCSTETDCVCPTVDTDTCNDSCTFDSECTGSEECIAGRCRNPSCSNETDCTCPVATRATPTPTPVGLPDAGVGLPTIIGIGAAALLFVGTIFLAL